MMSSTACGRAIVMLSAPSMAPGERGRNGRPASAVFADPFAPTPPTRERLRAATSRMPGGTTNSRRWRDPDSNRGHHDFQSCALPTELSRRGRVSLAVPCAQLGERIDEVAARSPASDPDLEVEVRAARVARVAHAAEGRAGGDGGALRDRERVGLAVGEEEVAAVGRAHDDVVAGAVGLVCRLADRAGDGGDDLRALAAEDVLALVGVARA